jgi:hypothetical protein
MQSDISAALGSCGEVSPGCFGELASSCVRNRCWDMRLHEQYRGGPGTYSDRHGGGVARRAFSSSRYGTEVVVEALPTCPCTQLHAPKQRPPMANELRPNLLRPIIQLRGTPTSPGLRRHSSQTPALALGCHCRRQLSILQPSDALLAAARYTLTSTPLGLSPSELSPPTTHHQPYEYPPPPHSSPTLAAR